MVFFTQLTQSFSDSTHFNQTDSYTQADQRALLFPIFPTWFWFRALLSPTLRKQPYYPYFLGCHVVKLNKEPLKHVFLHRFST